MKRQPLNYRLNVTGAALIIFLRLRTYVPPLLARVAGDSFYLLLAGYFVLLILSCLLPIAFIESMCDFHPVIFTKFSPDKNMFAIVGGGMLGFATLALFNRLLQLPLAKLGFRFPATALRPVSGFLSVTLYFVYVAVLPAVFEELFLRGTVMNLFREYGTRFAVLLSAFLFTVLHTDVGNFLPVFGAGVVLACVYIYTGSIYVSMLLHFTNNAYSFLIMYMQREVNGISAAAFAVFMMFTVFAAGVFSLLILKKEKINFLAPLAVKEKSPGFGRIFKSPVMLLGIFACLLAAFSRLYSTVILKG